MTGASKRKFVFVSPVEIEFFGFLGSARRHGSVVLRCTVDCNYRQHKVTERGVDFLARTPEGWLSGGAGAFAPRRIGKRKAKRTRAARTARRSFRADRGCYQPSTESSSNWFAQVGLEVHTHSGCYSKHPIVLFRSEKPV